MIDQMNAQVLARKHFDRDFSAHESAGIATMPPRGWVRAIRDALGMTARQLAARMGKSHSTLLALEKGEVAGTVTIAGLRRAAEALDCTLHYVLVPKRPLAETDLDAERKRLTDHFARNAGRRLWDQP